MRVLLALSILLATSLAGCNSDKGVLDADGDGLTDGEELNGWTIIIDFVGHRISRQVNSDPDKPDTDGDGITDTFELGLGLDPRSKDTDEDGLTDCQETYHTIVAECEDPNWEGQADRGTGTIGNNADSDPGYGRYINTVLGYDDQTGTISSDQVGWGDGIPDGEELAGYNITLPNGATITVHSDPMRKDSDGDFLEDGEEVLQFGTHPQVPDTDGDGCPDGLDLFPRFTEQFDIGLQSIRLNGAGQVHFTIRLVDALQESPGGSDGIAVPAGRDFNLTGLAGPPVRPAQCGFPPHQPVIPVELLAHRISSNGAQTLDLWSHTHPEGSFRMWWNVRTGTIAPAQEAAGQTGPITRTGIDGSITFAPSISPLTGQTT